MLKRFGDFADLPDLYDYPQIEGYLDGRYGGPNVTEPKKSNGQYIFRHILLQLSNKKQTTCEEIAKTIYQNEITSKRKLKSITDDVRKFIKNQLLSLFVVEENGAKQRYNKSITTYGLTIFGILYVIHLFNIRNSLGNNSKMIRKLANEYVETLPKIFGRFNAFKDILGEDFEYIIDVSAIPQDIGRIRIEGAVAQLSEITEFLPATNSSNKNGLDHIADQISFIIYNEMLDNIELHFRRQDRTKVISHQQNNKTEYTHKEKELLEHYKRARQAWKKILKSDAEIEKWYLNSLNLAIKQYEKRMKTATKIQRLLA